MPPVSAAPLPPSCDAADGVTAAVAVPPAGATSDAEVAPAGGSGVPIRRELDTDAAAVELAGEVANDAAVVAQISNINVVARNDGEDVAVEGERGPLLHEAKECGATSADEFAKIGQAT